MDRQIPLGPMGQEAQRNVPNDSDQFLATQIKLIQSDAVLRPVAAKYHLLQHEHQLPQDKRRAGNMEEAPIPLKRLKVSRPPNTYLLLIGYRSPEPQLATDVANGIARGYIANTFNIRLRSSLDLGSFMDKQLEELKGKMERSGRPWPSSSAS